MTTEFAKTDSFIDSLAIEQQARAVRAEDLRAGFVALKAWIADFTISRKTQPKRGAFA